MKRILTGTSTALGLCAFVLAGGCQNSMYEENSGLHKQNRDLQAHLSETRQDLQSRPSPAELVALRSEVAARDAAIAERDRMIRELQDRLNAPGADGKILDLGGDVDVGMTPHGDLIMSVAGDVLFASGSTAINKNAEATLARIAEVLNRDYAGKEIRVEGHTDTDPISKTKNLYADNRDLSLKRAYAVTTFLEGNGISPKRLETVGHGEHKPRSANKKDNRRVAIVVVMRTPINGQ